MHHHTSLKTFPVAIHHQIYSNHTDFVESFSTQIILSFSTITFGMMISIWPLSFLVFLSLMICFFAPVLS